ncbi:glycosyltransferase [bacterium]|jgi:glycosyltransferase involved in cell wall biosynthesis|nr:glycosyltransferase [bacterium]
MHKISIVLPNLKFGGAERLHLNLAKDWIQKGFQVEFILMQKSGEYLSLVPQGVTISCLRVNRLRWIFFPLVLCFRKSRPDIILAAMWPLTSYAIISWLLAGKIGKIYVSDHAELSFSSDCEVESSKYYLGRLIQFTYPFANGIIAVSNRVKMDLFKTGRLKFNKIKVIYNPVALGASVIREIQSDRIKLWGGDYAYNILTVGELKKIKDHETLIRAFSLLPRELNAKLVILGDGKLKGYLSQLVDQLNLCDRVNFPGFVHDPYPWYRTANLFVLSSRSEGFGNVIVEALECGVPVVSTDSGGPAEILDDGRYGRLTPVGDPVALSNAMMSSLKELHDHELLIKRAQDFSVSKISQQYLDYFFKIT